MAHNYDVGTRAWQPDAAEGWAASEVVEKRVDGDKVYLKFRLQNGEACCEISLKAHQWRLTECAE